MLPPLKAGVPIDGGTASVSRKQAHRPRQVVAAHGAHLTVVRVARNCTAGAAPVQRVVVAQGSWRPRFVYRASPVDRTSTGDEPHGVVPAELSHPGGTIAE